MSFSGRKQNTETDVGAFRLFAEKIGMFLKPAKVNELNIADPESVRLDSVVVIDMSTEQPLVEAFRHVKLMSHRGKTRISVLVNKVHSEVQAKSIFNKLTSLCENFLNVELDYLGGVPSDALLKNLDAANDVEETAASNSYYPNQSSSKAPSPLDFLQDYWVQTHPLVAAVKAKGE